MVPGQCWQLLVLNVPFSCLIAASGSVARRGEWSGWVIRNPKLLMLRQAGVCSEQKPWLWRLSRGPASECRFYGEDLYLVIWWVAMNERFKVIYYDIYKTHWWPALTVVSWESGKKNLRALPLKVNSLITHRWEQELLPEVDLSALWKNTGTNTDHGWRRKEGGKQFHCSMFNLLGYGTDLQNKLNYCVIICVTDILIYICPESKTPANTHVIRVTAKILLFKTLSLKQKLFNESSSFIVSKEDFALLQMLANQAFNVPSLKSQSF